MFIKLLSALTNGPLENANWIVQNYLGPIFSGAPFHLHVRLLYIVFLFTTVNYLLHSITLKGPALNLIVFGKKRW